MKKIIILIYCVLCFSNLYAQKEFEQINISFTSESIIRGTSTYSSQETITLTLSELAYLIDNSSVVCSKIDTLDDGSMMKTVEIESVDSSFKFIGAYMESNIFFPDEVSVSEKGNPMGLDCNFVLVDEAQLYESYELDALGRKCFKEVLNTDLGCVDPYD